jgi:GTP cyclohydrolase II
LIPFPDAEESEMSGRKPITALPDDPRRQEPAPSESLEHAPIIRVGSARLPTRHGEFEVTAYRDVTGLEHLFLRMGSMEGVPPLVRIHSECLTGDVLGSVRCDCGEQLQIAMEHIRREGRGALLYLRQEGRGIGLANKVLAYALQDEGMDTVEANLHLGLPADARTYHVAAAMLLDQGVGCIRLLTNNPQKITDLEACFIQVNERVAYHVKPRAENRRYLEAKAKKCGHIMPVTV